MRQRSPETRLCGPLIAPADRRLAAACGIAAPVVFVAGWLVNGLRTDGYDPLSDAISQLAREGAPTRAAMTASFVVFGVLLPVWAGTLARELDTPALRPVVTVAGLATIAVALFPLSRDPGGTQDLLHGIAAGTGYLAMALTPLVAAVGLWRSGRTTAAGACLAVGAVSAGALVATLFVDGSGGVQRLGLTVVDAWHLAVAVWVLRR